MTYQIQGMDKLFICSSPEWHRSGNRGKGRITRRQKIKRRGEENSERRSAKRGYERRPEHVIPDLACPDFDHAFDRPGIVKPSMNYQLMSNNSYLLKVLQSDYYTTLLSRHWESNPTDYEIQKGIQKP